MLWLEKEIFHKFNSLLALWRSKAQPSRHTHQNGGQWIPYGFADADTLNGGGDWGTASSASGGRRRGGVAVNLLAGTENGGDAAGRQHLLHHP